MQIALLREFFMWCTIINWGVLLFAFLMCAMAGDWIYRMHSRWFPISREAFNVTLYAFIGGYKLLIFVFCLVPYLTLLIME